MVVTGSAAGVDDLYLENSIEFVVPTPWVAKWHAHRKDHEFIIVRQGEVETRIADRVISAGPGGILFYPRDMFHLPSAKGRNQAVFQAIRWRAEKSVPAMLKPTSVFDRPGRIGQMANWIHQSWPPVDAEARHRAHLWLAAIVSEFSILRTPRAYPWVERIQAEIRRHLAEPITLDDLARFSNMSKFHLTRKFKSATGLSPAQYVTRLRVEQAKGLLLHTDKPIEAIAEEVGFCDASHLSRHFRSHFNENPGAFRNRAAETVQSLS